MDFQILRFRRASEKSFWINFIKCLNCLDDCLSTEMIVQQSHLSFSLTKPVYRGGVTGTDVCK